jgi:hypothetical protein
VVGMITDKNIKNERLLSLLMRLCIIVKKDDAWEMSKWMKSDTFMDILDLLKELYPGSYSLFVRRVIEHAAR